MQVLVLVLLVFIASSLQVPAPESEDKPISRRMCTYIERWIYSTPDHYFSEELVLRGGIIRDHRSAGYKAAFENTKP